MTGEIRKLEERDPDVVLRPSDRLSKQEGGREGRKEGGKEEGLPERRRLSLAGAPLQG